MMVDGYFLAVNQETIGPFTAEEVKERINTGLINQSTLVWQQGMEQWVQIGSLPIFDFVVHKKDIIPPPLPNNSNMVKSPEKEKRQGSYQMPNKELIGTIWAERTACSRKSNGFLGSIIGNKQIKSHVLNGTGRVPKVNSFQESITREEIYEKLCSRAQSQGFVVQDRDPILVLKRYGEMESDSYAIMNSFCILWIADRPNGWEIKYKAETEFFSKAMDKMLSTVALFIVFLLIFWPCICLIPLIWGFDEDKCRHEVDEMYSELIKKNEI